MKILRKDDASGSKSKPFVVAVQELAKDAAATLRIYERSGLKGKYLAEIPIAEGVELARSFEESLKAEFGGGEYQIALCNADTEVKGKYSFDIAGPPKGRRPSDDESLRGSRAATSDRQMFTEMVGKLIDAAISNKAGTADDFQRTLELAKTLKGDDGLTPKDLIEFAQAFQGQSGGGSEVISAFMNGFELRGEVQPQIEREDSTTAILQTVMPLIASFIGKKQGIPAGAVDPTLIQQIEQAVTKRFQGVSNAAPMAGQPPPPGASHSQAAAGAGLGGPADDLAASPGSPDPAPQAGTQEYFQERFIAPFQKDVAAGHSDEALAYQIVSMTTYARDQMADAPPPLVADFLTAAGLAEYDAALQKFFAAIPELANLRPKCEGIKSALIEMFMKPGDEQQTTEDLENVQDADNMEGELESVSSNV